MEGLLGILLIFLGMRKDAQLRGGHGLSSSPRSCAVPAPNRSLFPRSARIDDQRLRSDAPSRGRKTRFPHPGSNLPKNRIKRATKISQSPNNAEHAAVSPSQTDLQQAKSRSAPIANNPSDRISRKKRGDRKSKF